MAPVTLLIIGAGSRGTGYARFAEALPERARVVGVAEPRDFHRNRIAATHNIPGNAVARDWRELAERPRLADAVVIATQDAMHVEPAVTFASKGYAMLLEKPMAPNEADCRRIAEAVAGNRTILAVGHVMRYTRYTQVFKNLLDSGAVGEIVSVQHLEPVGYWHQAHSFVRGSWRNERESSFMLLAKSCHDIDWLRYIVGSPCASVSSFGNLKHFRKEAKPAEAGHAVRCTACAHEARCPYSALRIYIGRVRAGQTGWPVEVVASEGTEEAVRKALEKGPYGRCVYECDNDVVDHQVVNMSFRSGATAVFTMTAFNKGGHRRTLVFGTRGSLEGDGAKITHYDFLTDTATVVDTEAEDPSILGGHGGGDFGLMSNFVSAVAANDPSMILSGPEESLETHLMVFAAERARKENRVVNL